MQSGSEVSGPKLNSLSIEKVEKEIRKYSFGVLSSVDSAGHSHSVGIVYAVSAPGSPLRIYIMTQKKTRKIANIKGNPNVSFAIPCLRMVFTMVPPACIQFQGIAEVLSINDTEAISAFRGSYLLRMMLEKSSEIQNNSLGEPCYLCIKPKSYIHTYGVGMSMFELYRNIENAASKVKISV